MIFTAAIVDGHAEIIKLEKAGPMIEASKKTRKEAQPQN
jgi:hypothetical protein